jgi:hypothetical protein
MNTCEVCGAELELTEPGIVYAVELEMVNSSRGLKQLDGYGAFFHATCVPEESEEWVRKPMALSVYERGA